MIISEAFVFWRDTDFNFIKRRHRQNIRMHQLVMPEIVPDVIAIGRLHISVYLNNANNRKDTYAP